jgi:hypothetical protein
MRSRSDLKVGDQPRQGPAPAQTIYLFRCGESGLYAFTADPNGHILPSRIYPRARWRFERLVTMRPERSSLKRKMAKATLDAIVEHGFHLAHAAVSTELLAFTVQHHESPSLNATR